MKCRQQLCQQAELARAGRAQHRLIVQQAPATLQIGLQLEALVDTDSRSSGLTSLGLPAPGEWQDIVSEDDHEFLLDLEEDVFELEGQEVVNNLQHTIE